MKTQIYTVQAVHTADVRITYQLECTPEEAQDKLNELIETGHADGAVELGRQVEVIPGTGR